MRWWVPLVCIILSAYRPIAKKDESMKTDSNNEQAKPETQSSSRRKLLTPSCVTALIALTISVLSSWYTATTYAVSYRPYIGIIEQDYKLLGDPPSAMTWRFVLSNAGSIPAWVTVEKNESVITTGGQTITLPTLGELRGGILLLPDQTADLQGQFADVNDQVDVADVLSGRSILEIDIQLSYSSPGAFGFRKHYYYRVHNRFRTSVLPPSFIMTSAEAN